MPDACCEYRGLFYAPNDRRCLRHSTPEERALVADLDRRAKPILGAHGWPYGANIDIQSRRSLVEWAGYHALKLSGTQCTALHWVLKGQCSGPPECGDVRQLGRWMDHFTYWSHLGKPALLLAQPYGIGSEGLLSLARVAAREELTVRIRAGHWYGHGTVGIEIWRTDIETARVNSRFGEAPSGRPSGE
jgi:hypothetical protein